jgi:hypothetical protein
MRRKRTFRPGLPEALEDRRVPAGLALRAAPEVRAPAPSRLLLARPLPLDKIDAEYATLRQQIAGAVEAGQTFGTDAASLQAYVVNLTQAMNQRLLTYFNNLPGNLPRSVAPPRRTAPRNAIQTFIAAQLVGGGSNSLLPALGQIPLPSGQGLPTLLFLANLDATLQANRLAMIDGVRAIWANRSNQVGLIQVGPSWAPVTPFPRR